MAILHRTTLTPTKLELLATWLPHQPWFIGDPESLDQIGSFRFDDPGETVGIETLLLTAGDDTVFQVPLTYRDAPAGPLRAALVGELEHGVLGHRWVYDGTADPAYVQGLIQSILSGTGEAVRFTDDGGELTMLENDTRVRGSGLDVDDLSPEAPIGTVSTTATRIETGIGIIDLVRCPSLDTAAPEPAGILAGTWPGQVDPVLLASLQLDAAAVREALRG